MRRVLFLTAALIIPLVLAAPQIRVSATRATRPANYAAGEVVIKLKSGAPELRVADQAERLMRISRLGNKEGSEFSDRSAEPLAGSTSNKRVSEIIADLGLDRVFVLKLDAGEDVQSIVSELRARDDVEYAEPNYLITFGTVPDDPQFAVQWALFNPGFLIGEFFSTPNADIKASQAWDITVGSPDVIVAVSDTGVDLTHPDLERNIYTNPGEIPGNLVDDDQNGFIDDVHGFNVADQNGDTTDAVGHGTFMAGVIAAEMNNNLGISGITQSKILPARFYKRTGPHPTQFSATVIDGARSLLYSIAAGASIINASWSTKLISVDAPAETSQVLEDAVKATNDAGALLVCLAGNEGFNLDFSKIYPASYGLPNQIVVAASDFNDEIWHPLFTPWVITTGFGARSVNLAAPGVSVLTTQARGDCFLCTQSLNPQDWYARQDGTSISAAYVSGVAALVKSRYPNDSAILLKRRILEGVEVKDSLRTYDGELTVITGGRLSALGALTAQLTITPPTLTEFTYKAKKEKFNVFGSGMQQGVQVIVGKAAFSTKPRSDDGTAFLARVPKSAVPAGIPVEIKVRNPDGGESQVIMLTR